MADLERLKGLVKDFPRDPGVYLMKNAKEKIIYVGKAKDLRARVKSYFTKSKDHSLKTLHLVNQIDSIDYMLTGTEVEAFLLEASLIKKHRPRYNIRLKDDKSYPYIRCSMKDDFPRFYLSRRVLSDGSLYFGPYTSGLAVRETIRFVNRTFKIRDCRDSYMKNRKRPCMTHQIGRCTAPCVNFIDKIGYGEDVEASLEFLRGNDQKVLGELKKKMKKASKDERFEAAGKYRDSIDAVNKIWERQSVVSTDKDMDRDVIAFFGDERGVLVESLHIRAGRVIGNRSHLIAKLDPNSPDEDAREWFTSFLNQYYSDNIIPDELILPVDLGGDIYKLLLAVFHERQGKRPRLIHALDEEHKKLMDMAKTNATHHFEQQMAKRDHRIKGLEDIQSRLKLPALPKRIECYDISNFQGSESVASQVVYEDGVPKKEDYRRYKIRTVEGSNDFASMKEVLTRRFRHTEYDDPDLLVVDGGKGQLKMAMEVLEEIGRPEIPVAGLAKARVKGEFSDQEVHGTEERVFLPGRQNPVTFARSAEALKILTGIRDEAHRFAITYHRKLRDRVTLNSKLDEISGLGEKRKVALLKKFKSVENIRVSTVKELSSISGISPRLAEDVIQALNEEEPEAGEGSH